MSDDDEVDFPGIERLHDVWRRHGLTPAAVYRAYHTQEGLCFATGYPMAGDCGDGWYSIEAVPFKVHRPISDTNIRLVCSMVARMKPELMTWEQFRQMCSSVAETFCTSED